jgi:predicted nicotinamide N-methyase
MSRVRIRYQTIEFGDTDIHLRTLRDRQQFCDEGEVAERLGISSATWPLFGVVWESGEILARLMYRYDIRRLRILEVGCGIGLASLVLSHRHADITATDHHPEAAGFLAENTALNDLDPIPFVRTGWEQDHSGLERYDLIVGSDLLYEADNIAPLSAFIARHGAAHARVVMVDPGRGLQGRFVRTMVGHGFRHDASVQVDNEISDSFRGRVLTFTRAG